MRKPRWKQQPVSSETREAARMRTPVEPARPAPGAVLALVLKRGLRLAALGLIGALGLVGGCSRRGGHGLPAARSRVS